MTHTPTAAEIETLRKIVNGELDRETDYAAIIAANNTLDRLSPPAPEVDEATRIWQKAFSLWEDAQSANQGMAASIAYLRTALSELIASKDAEIERLRKFLIEIEQMHDDATVGAARHVARLALKAAERNTAEPALDGETSVFPPSSREGACALADRVETSATNTTPEVVRMTPEYLRGYAAEFEARGRREALEEALKWLRSPAGKGSEPGVDYADGFADQIERMMTGGK